MIDWAYLITTVVTTCVGTASGWLAGRKKYNTEVHSNEIKNFDSAIDAYKKLYEDREKIYEGTILSLNKRVDELTEENKELRKQVMTISNFITTYMIQSQSKKNKIDITPLIDLTSTK